MRDLIEKEDNFQGMTPSHKPPRKSKTPQERKARDDENFRGYMQGVDDYQCLKARGAQHRSRAYSVSGQLEGQAP